MTNTPSSLSVSVFFHLDPFPPRYSPAGPLNCITELANAALDSRRKGACATPHRWSNAEQHDRFGFQGLAALTSWSPYRELDGGCRAYLPHSKIFQRSATQILPFPSEKPLSLLFPRFKSDAGRGGSQQPRLLVLDPGFRSLPTVSRAAV